MPGKYNFSKYTMASAGKIGIVDLYLDLGQALLIRQLTTHQKCLILRFVINQQLINEPF